MTSTIATFTIEPEQRTEIVRQIGMGNLLSISGGRRYGIADGIELPVSNGYWVRVQLTADDDYIVSRLFRRAGKEVIKGQRDRVYANQVGSATYFASCFRSYDEYEWPTRSA